MTYARQQLFHWVGSHLEGPSKFSATEKRKKYVECLRDVLTQGLWMKRPRERDELPGGAQVSLPITSFTDWDLRSSGQHTDRYGKLGFGVTKKFVLAAGGHPVMYTHEKSKLNRVFATLRREVDREGLKESPIATQLDFIAHYVKRIKPPVKPSKKRRERRSDEVIGDSVTGGVEHPDRVFLRAWNLQSTSFLEEREWRVVYAGQRESLVKRTEHEEDNLAKPTYRLMPRLGYDLVTVVLPDNAAIHYALTDDVIREALMPKGARRPHVALISLAEVGTY